MSSLGIRLMLFFVMLTAGLATFSMVYNLSGNFDASLAAACAILALLAFFLLLRRLLIQELRKSLPPTGPLASSQTEDNTLPLAY